MKMSDPFYWFLVWSVWILAAMLYFIHLTDGTLR